MDDPASPCGVPTRQVRPRGGANFRPKLLFDASKGQYVLWFNFQ